MRIRRRHGSIGVETMMAIPVVIVVILLSRFILEASLNRQEIAVYTRGSTVAAAANSSTSTTACAFEDAPFLAQARVTQNQSTTCRHHGAERGLQREKPMWDALYDGAAPWQDILRDVRLRTAVQDIRGYGSSTMSLTEPQFLAQQSPVTSQKTHMRPQADLWAHSSDPYAAGHDAVIWDELQKENTHLMFPNVFPSR